jgi:hypothetical protein
MLVIGQNDRMRPDELRALVREEKAALANLQIKLDELRRTVLDDTRLRDAARSLLQNNRMLDRMLMDASRGITPRRPVRFDGTAEPTAGTFKKLDLTNDRAPDRGGWLKGSLHALASFFPRITRTIRGSSSCNE